MQFVRNSHWLNVLPEPDDSDGILKHIERIGRLCYRSDGLIEEGSAPGFIDRLKGRKHLAMLEHYIFTMSIPKRIFDCIMDSKWQDKKYIDYQQKMKFVNITSDQEMADNGHPE